MASIRSTGLQREILEMERKEKLHTAELLSSRGNTSNCELIMAQ
jgi:hypothetical protein